MLFPKREALLLLLGATTLVFGSPEEHPVCPAKSQEQELPQGVVDCGDISVSLDNLALYLSDTSASFSGDVIDQDPNDVVYEELRHQYASSRFPTWPSYILQPENEVSVQAAVMFGAHCGYKVTARSGGHSYLGISSCNSDDGACIQLDVGKINHIVATEMPSGGKKLNVGPGANLEELADLYANEGIFIPGGECTDLGVGGHMQTGGYGPFGRMFGAFSHYVTEFKIVLADGSLHTVTKPALQGPRDRLNDDLFYGVIGGASGSFGVIVDVSFRTIHEDDYFSFYWEVNFLYNDATLPGIKQMLRKYVDIVKDPDFQNDQRWAVWGNIVGSKFLLGNSGLLPFDFAFNYFQIDVIWTELKRPGLEESQALANGKAFYESIVNDCVGCIFLDDYFDSLGAPQLKGLWPSVKEVSAPLSSLYKDISIFDFHSFGVEDFPFKTSYQQGSNFPEGDDVEEILDRIDQLIPKNPQDARLLVSQLVTILTSSFADADIALPFQEDVFGVTLDVWDLTGGSVDYSSAIRAAQDRVIEAFGGVDHRMFWAAYEEPCLDCGDYEKYYESKQKYDRLVRIKSCVDSDNVFESRMSLPVKNQYE